MQFALHAAARGKKQKKGVFKRFAWEVERSPRQTARRSYIRIPGLQACQPEPEYGVAPPVLRDLSACVFQERGVDSGPVGFLIGRLHTEPCPAGAAIPTTTHANEDRPFCCRSAL
ncbi:hypothetical protein TgHK011_009221 [Trichoderma gracile]|nr:hypothetical protein TgHK011_009221 [Trichoderma gracile]